MKKWVALLLTIIMVVSLTACGGNGNNTNVGDDKNPSQNQNGEKDDGKSGTNIIVNDDGEEFTPDVSAIGEVEEGAETLSSTKFELAGTTYTFPIKMSELFDNGWDLSKGYEYQTEFDANTSTNLVSYYLVHDGGIKIHLDQMTNDSSEKQEIKNCTLTGFSINTYDLMAASDYVIPGGITPKSTAANVISVFGNPNTTSDFAGYSYNLDDQLTYSKQSHSNISYSFSFNEDGTISAIKIGYEK